MLRDGLERASRERRLSVRALAKKLAYKQATVLSHMANGRVAVPLERASGIARELDLPEAEFLVAAVEQRAPQAADLLRKNTPIQSTESVGSGFITQLAEIVGTLLEHLNEEQKQVVREVVLEPRPRRRWLSTAELPAVLVLRQARPEMTKDGLPSIELERLLRALSGGSLNTHP
jgi:hypothetical protein